MAANKRIPPTKQPAAKAALAPAPDDLMKKVQKGAKKFTADATNAASNVYGGAKALVPGQMLQSGLQKAKNVLQKVTGK